MSDGGKGSTPRKVDFSIYGKNFDRIYGKHRVSGVPYEVELVDQYTNDIAELERENFMLRTRVQRLEEELDRIRDDGK